MKSLKICTLIEYLCQKYVTFELKWEKKSIAKKSFNEKSREELSLMTLKSDPKLKEKLTFCLKNDMRNLINFNLSSEKSENLHFYGIFLSKVCNVWPKII